MLRTGWPQNHPSRKKKKVNKKKPPGKLVPGGLILAN
jgi:hypothetical protein